jgi:Flp pilus assembly pilin Flp
LEAAPGKASPSPTLLELRRRREEGQTMAEYTVGLSVITIVVITAISLLSDRVLNTITGVANVLPGH